jgi:DNA-binding MarR family transcriptional regulator
LTDHGKSMVREMKGSIEAAHRRLVEPLEKNERRQFVRQLLKLVEANNDKGRAALHNL